MFEAIKLAIKGMFLEIKKQLSRTKQLVTFGIRGQLGADVGSVVALLVVIAIGALVLYSVTGALDVEPGSYAENAIHSVEEKGGTAFNLMSILAIVVVAAVKFRFCPYERSGAKAKRNHRRRNSGNRRIPTQSSTSTGVLTGR